MSPGQAAAWSTMVVLFNACMVTAFVLFARAWSGTGMAPPWRGRATVVFLGMALAVDAKSLLNGGRAVLAGQPWAIGYVASAAGDIAAITLVGPVFATAIALRGGILMRPWLFLFVGCAFWLSVDVIAVLPAELRRDPDMLLRALAILLGAAAAVAQVVVKRDVRASLGEA
jgi:hypothetical protein